MAKNKFTYDVTIRYFDLDTNNHVNNSVYFTYMEEARTKLLLKQFLKCKENGISFVVAEAKCKFKKPIRMQDRVSIKISIQNIKGISFEIHYVFVDPLGQSFAEGNTRMACVDEKTQKLIRLPKEIVNDLQLNV